MASQTAPGTIVVGVDGSPGADQALDWAADQAALEHRPLTLVHAGDPVAFAGGGDYLGASSDYAALRDAVREAGAALLALAAERVRAGHAGVDVTQLGLDVDPRTALLELSRDAATVVLGSRGRGPVASLLLGSVSVAVARHASCPVVVLRPGLPAGGGVMVGVDGTERSLPAVEVAYRAASLRGCPLTVVHCWSEPAQGARRRPAPGTGDEAALTSESLAGMREKFPDVPVEVRLVPGDGAHELLAASDGFALLVVGHDRRPLRHGLRHDRVATTVLEHARCPVAVVPSD